MLETLVITFREGLEAFLIVAIMLAYLTNTGRTQLIKPVYIGIAVAILISATTGWHVAELANDPVWEGILAMIAGAMVASFTVYIMKTAKNIRGKIGEQLEKSAQKDGMGAMVGVFIFTVLMISREGMETALMLGAISAQNDSSSMMVGALIGVVSVAMVAVLWKYQSHRINLRIFMQVSGIFLVMFSVYLFVYGVYEVTEIEGGLPVLGADMTDAIHQFVKPAKVLMKSDLMTAGMLLIPMAWLGITMLRNRNTPSAAAE